MSLCNLIVQDEAAYLVTDSAFFDETGQVLMHEPKSILIDGVPVVISAVGSGHILAKVHIACLEVFAKQAFTLDRFKQVVKRVYERDGHNPAQEMTRWIAAYYSAELSRAFGCYFFTDPADGEPEANAWRWYPKRAMILPYVEPVEVWGTDTTIDITKPENFNPRADSMKFVQAQRKPTEWASGRNGIGVGGEIRITKVSAKGVEEWKLHEFDDRVGEVIQAR
ncbi:hypothetical protein [Altererythrobacter lutimaris]|uniref:Uncharacterized protein n=1 Tax=Altererythrobacter lutimaris TaxID=2743979 RepID=A0A850H807_9SPHN|nr:hypothetical protein [Altererythrobacter lutimaris]NVE93375.1 hypothetical protein [Altererythrobacter lutimaris]